MTAPAVQPTTLQTPSGKRLPLSVRISIALTMVTLIVPVGLVALGSGAGAIALPYEIFELAGRIPYLFHLHMLAGAAALLLAPIVIALRGSAKFHRPLGRLLGGFVVIGGLTAFPVAVLSQSPVAARAGFFVQGIVWLVLLWLGYRAIRRGDLAGHLRRMTEMVAVTTGAVWFRLITGTAILLKVPFEPVYAASAWIGWMLPLALVGVAGPKLTPYLWPRPSRPATRARLAARDALV